MKVLFIGGTGNISRACSREAAEQGIELFLLHRGSGGQNVADGVNVLRADMTNPDQVRAVLGTQRFDAVVDWICYDADEAARDVELFSGRCGQFVFISSASVYRKPPTHHVISESTPLGNPYWEYSRKKIAAEVRFLAAFRDQGFPVTIVRPSHTYNDGWTPTTFGSRDFTVPKRMLDGRPIVVHGDGQSLWTITHAEDFAVGLVGLLGDPRTIGESFNITGDEALTWDGIHLTIAHALGVEPRIVHVPSDFIREQYPEVGDGLVGDKAYSTLFDTSKIRRFVPRFRQSIPFHEGIRRSIEWLERHPESKIVSEEIDRKIDFLINTYAKSRPV